MPKFGNNIETNITGSPQCGNFFKDFYIRGDEKRVKQ